MSEIFLVAQRQYNVINYTSHGCSRIIVLKKRIIPIETFQKQKNRCFSFYKNTILNVLSIL